MSRRPAEDTYPITPDYIPSPGDMIYVRRDGALEGRFILATDMGMTSRDEQQWRALSVTGKAYGVELSNHRTPTKPRAMHIVHVEMGRSFYGDWTSTYSRHHSLPYTDAQAYNWATSPRPLRLSGHRDPRVDGIFRRAYRKFRKAFPAIGVVKLVLTDRHFLPPDELTARDVAWFDDDLRTVFIHTAALDHDDATLEGLIWHELGHAAEADLDAPECEARADHLAKLAIGRPVRYTEGGMQNSQRGEPERPAWLHRNPRAEVRTIFVTGDGGLWRLNRAAIKAVARGANWYDVGVETATYQSIHTGKWHKLPKALYWSEDMRHPESAEDGVLVVSYDYPDEITAAARRAFPPRRR